MNSLQKASLVPGKQAFSLTEVLVSIAVVAVLVGLLFAGVVRIRNLANGAKCINNLRQIAAASTAYISENNGNLPYGLEKGIEAGSSTWSGNQIGAWYWNLAPYLSVQRWETEKDRLGPPGGKLNAACVFTCPSHRSSEPYPISYPSSKPVSYAPSTRVRTDDNNVSLKIGTVEIYRLKITQITDLSKKVWISDSIEGISLNVSAGRWDEAAPDSYAWGRVSFSRHHGSGNALFFDGHIQQISYRSIISGNLNNNLEVLFTPYK